MARSGDRCGDRARRRRRDRADRRARGFRLRTFGDAGRARHRVSPPRRAQRRPRLSRRAGGRRRERLHRRSRRAGAPDGQRRIALRRRRPAVPARVRSLSAHLRRAGSRVMSWLGALYPWLKALHIISVIAWMAGLLYLPRLFVYHAKEPAGSPTAETLKTMERRLLRGIMNPAMAAVVVRGVLLALTPGVVDLASVWIYAKLLLVAGLPAP